MTISSVTISNEIDMPENSLPTDDEFLPAFYGNSLTTSYDMVPSIDGTIVSFTLSDNNWISVEQVNSKKVRVSMKKNPFKETWTFFEETSITSWEPPPVRIKDYSLEYEIVYETGEPLEEVTETGTLTQRVYWDYTVSLEEFETYVSTSER